MSDFDWQPLTCSICGKQISSPVPRSTQIRAWIECYKCHNQEPRKIALETLVESVLYAASQANWMDEALVDALDAAQKIYK
jgi:hypothetical protein